MKSPGNKVNTSKNQDDFNKINSNFTDKKNSSNETYNSIIRKRKININKDTQNKSSFNFISEKSNQKSNQKSKNTINNENNLENKDKLDKTNKSILKKNDIPYKKKPLNLRNKYSCKTLFKEKTNSQNKSLLDISTKFNQNNNRSFHNKRKLNQSKNNFLKLINKDNKNDIFNDSSYSLMGKKDFVEVINVDSLNLIEKNLQNKIYDMGKEAEFLEFEINPLEITISKLNIKNKMSKLSLKGTKRIELDKNDIHRTSKKNNTVINKSIFNNLMNSNLNNSNSEENFLNKNEKIGNFNKNINNINKNFINLNFKNKMKIKKKISNANKQYKLNITGNKISGMHSPKNRFIKSSNSIKSPKLNKSKTYSNLNISSGENNASLNNNSRNLIKIKKRKGICIDMEKFRVLTHKKLVYDSVDDEEIIEDFISDNFYLKPNDKIVLIVDGFILIFTFWSMIFKPLSLVLNNCDIKNTLSSLNFENIINIFIDILFIFDLCINFFKSYYNFDEQLVTKSKKIILNYIKGYFIIDFISAVPYYSILKFIAFNKHKNMIMPVKCTKYYNHQIHDIYQIIELLKLVKLMKCISNNNIITSYIINEINNIIFFENWSFLLSNIFIFLLVLHLTACLHIFISSTAFPNWIIYKNLQTSPFITVYLSSIYFLITTVTSVGYGDIIGNSFTEINFQIFLLMVGIIAYSWLISSLSNYVKENNEQNEIFNRKLSILKDIKLEHPKMPKELYDKIYLHLEYINLRQKKDKSSLIDCLPHSVKKSLLYEMYKPIIENFNFFKNFKNSEFVNRVISKLKPVIAVRNDLLLEQGEIIEDTIFVKQGRLSLEVKIDIDHPEKSVEKLLSEEYFFGIENNDLYQRSTVGGIINKTLMNHNQSFINKKNLYNLYSGNTLNENNEQKRVKSIITNTHGENEIQKHPNTNINYIHLRILDIRKNEHFGALLMFLNKRSPLSLRVKTKKAELFFLRKIDAVEISTSYPNIWKRVNKKSYHNLKQIKKIMKKIIIHFCETYGIDFDFGSKNNISSEKLNTSLSKLYSFNDKKSIHKFGKKLNNSKRISVDVLKTQLKMFKFLPKNNDIISSKTNVEKNIEELVPKNFGVNNNIENSNEIDNTNKDKKNNERNSLFKKIESVVVDNDNPIDCSVSIINIEKKDSMLGYGHPIYIRNNNIMDNSYNKKLNNSSILVNSIDNNLSKSIKFKSANKNSIRKNLNNKVPIVEQYSKEETNNLIKFFGTPYYPQDINDEVYPGEIFNIFSNMNFSGSKNSHNNIILSYDTKNNNSSSKSKNNHSLPFSLNKDNNYSGTNIFNINNNYIAKNVFNNLISEKNNNNNLSIFRFSFNLKNEIPKPKNYLKINDEHEKNIKFSIIRNSFQLCAFRKPNLIIGEYFNTFENKKNVNFNKKKNNDNLIDNLSNDKNKIINNCNKQTENPKSFSESFSSDGSFSYNSSSSNNSNLNNKKNENIHKTKTKTKDLNKLNTLKSIKSTLRTNKSNNINENPKCLKIKKSVIINIEAKYENLNMITKGKFSKSKKLQKCIKDILIKKLLKHKEKIPSPKKRKSVGNNRLLIKNKTMAKIPFNFSNNNLYKVNLNNDKLKKTEVKKIFKNHLMSDIHEKSSGINTKKTVNFKESSKISSSSIPKREKTKKNNDQFLLSYVSRNIRDDNAVLNNPGKFYNGFFNTIMKKVNLAKIK